MARREFSIFIIFLIDVYVLVLCRKFGLILIKIGFFMNFKVTRKAMYYIHVAHKVSCLSHLGLECFVGNPVFAVCEMVLFYGREKLFFTLE